MFLEFFFFFQAEDGIRDLVRSRGLGDVYKRQTLGRQQSRQGHVSRHRDDQGRGVALLRADRAGAALSLIHI